MFIFCYINAYKLIKQKTSMELVALLSSGKGTWAQVAGLINRGEWDKIVLIGSDFAEKFATDKPHDFVKFNPNDSIINIKEDLREKLKDKFQGTEVALSIASGEGREHMALISALLSIPVGVRFTALTKEGIIFF